MDYGDILCSHYHESLTKSHLFAGVTNSGKFLISRMFEVDAQGLSIVLKREDDKISKYCLFLRRARGARYTR